MTTSSEQAKAYATVARAIRFIRERAQEQPRLEEVAAHVGLSEFHLQRVFSAWAGISPKRFLQVLTVNRAAATLRSASGDVLGAALDTGLSGPSRLHDLMVACSAVTPGEMKAGGAGIDIVWGRAETPFGEAIIGTTARGICHLQFRDDARDEAALFAEWPNARFVHDDGAAESVAADVFASAERKRALSVLLKGTNFQVQVWQALLRVPAASTTTYGEIASALGKPQASRAVGGAVGKNHVAVLIPCHRVLREGGELGGYRWGPDRKAALLAWEAA